MNPSPRRQAIVVGLFVTAGTAILLAGVLTVGNLNDTFSRRIAVSAVFDQVSGLQKGDNVWYYGVKVGVVTSVELEGPDAVAVGLSVDEDVAGFLRADTVATLGSDGLIGNRLVILTGGSPEAARLREGGVLPTGRSVSSEQIMATLQQNNLYIEQITAKLARGEGTVGKLLQDDLLYANLMATTATLGAASDNARELTGSLAALATDLNREGSFARDLATDRTTYAALTGGVGRLNETGDRAFDLVDGLARGAADPGSPVGALMHDREAGADVTATLGNLREGSELLNEDLTALQHNFLLRGYFRKQARVEARAAAKAARVADRR